MIERPTLINGDCVEVLRTLPDKGFRFLGVELSEQYMAIAEARIGHAIEEATAAIQDATARTAQLDIFGEALI